MSLRAFRAMQSAPVGGTLQRAIRSGHRPNTKWITIRGGSAVPLKFNVYYAAGGIEITDASQVSF